MLSIIIPIYNQLDMTAECITAIRENTKDCEIIIVDNGSEPAFKAPFTGFIDLRIIRNDDNKGFPIAVNQGIKEAKGSIICLLNNDVIVTPGWDEMLIEALDDYSIVGPITNYAAGMQRTDISPYANIPELYGAAEAWAKENDEYGVQDANFIIGFCMVFRKSLYDEIGEFDESLWPCSGEEIDFCLRARQAGHKIGIVTACYVHHEGSFTFNEMQQSGQVDYNEICKRNDSHLATKWGSDFWDRQTVGILDNDGLLRLNLGCGLYKLAGFINVDQFEDVKPDLVCDVLALPFKVGTVDEIYCGHMLEHLNYNEGQQALSYWNCLLKPGGKISVTVPDFDVIATRYLAAPTALTLREINDRYIYSYCQESPHRYCYSGDLLRLAMEEAGIKDIKRLSANHPYFVDPVDCQVGYEGVKA